MTTFSDYLDDLFFYLLTPLPAVAVVSALLAARLKRKSLFYVAAITSAAAFFKLLIYMFEMQDDDHQFAMWGGCVLFPYGTFTVLATITVFALVSVYLRSQNKKHAPE